MLKQRIATAIVLAAALLALVLLASPPWFALGLSLPVLVAAQEWSTLTEIDNSMSRMVWVLAMGGMLALVWWFRATLALPLALLGCIWWLLVLIKFLKPPARIEFKGTGLLAGFLMLVPAWAALLYLHQAGPHWLLTLILIVCLADIAAYFCGRAWGRRKLAPQISPGKTVEGAVGGIVAAGIFGAVIAIWTGAGLVCGLAWFAACIVTAIFSIVGDLWESKVKRSIGVKDSGSILPGHGGVLDRIDSITAAAPVFVSLLFVSQNFGPICDSIT